MKEENPDLAERIAFLIAGHLKDSLSSEEADELDEWIAESDENLELFEKLTDEDDLKNRLLNFHNSERIIEKINKIVHNNKYFHLLYLSIIAILSVIILIILLNEKIS